MKKNWEFTPELGLFIFFTAVFAFVFFGLVYYLVIRYVLGLNVTSWWRSIIHNANVGGVANSLHLVGMAWDIAPVTQEAREKLEGIGLKVIDEGDHLHAQIL